MKINDALIDRISKLAYLDFKSEKERRKIMTDLQKILDFMDTLNTLDTSNVDPLVYMSDQENIAGKDEISHVLTPEETFRNAPDHDGRYFMVPKVINKKK
jgi:aspartyl-tRNA(Asn)/glutamyl-tRNA(Gln) amidotransferase subunit C